MNKHVYKSVNWFMCLEGQKGHLWGFTSKANVTEYTVN